MSKQLMKLGKVDEFSKYCNTNNVYFERLFRIKDGTNGDSIKLVNPFSFNASEGDCKIIKLVANDM